VILRGSNNTCAFFHDPQFGTSLRKGLSLAGGLQSHCGILPVVDITNAVAGRLGFCVRSDGPALLKTADAWSVGSIWQPKEQLLQQMS
jgi:hypothetical protein